MELCEIGKASRFNHLNNNWHGRASGIFPIIKTNGFKTFINFLSYWHLKNNLDVILFFSLRDDKGILIERKVLNPIKTHTYRIDLQEEFNDLNPTNQDKSLTIYSLEVEIISEMENRFPYPALLYEVETTNSYSVVHSCSRTLNPEEEINQLLFSLPQTGFDVIFDNEGFNFFAIVGGVKLPEYSILLTISTPDIEREIIHEMKLDNSYGYKTHIVNIDDILRKYNMKSGFYKCSIEVKDLDIFPRWICGKINTKSKSHSVSHTFFDTSDIQIMKSGRDYNNCYFAPSDNTQAPTGASFILPIYRPEEFQTTLVSYGQNPSFDGHVHLILHDSSNNPVSHLKISSTTDHFLQDHSYTNLNDMFSDALVGNEFMYAQFIFDSDKLPFRMKYGLNIQRKTKEISDNTLTVTNGLLKGTNICFAPRSVVQSDELLKPLTRNWAPIGGKNKIIVFYYLNWFFGVDRSLSTSVKCSLISSKGLLSKKTLIISPGKPIFFSSGDPWLNSFDLDTRDDCWIYFEANYWGASGFFFSIKPSIIGGDHIF